MWIPLPRSIHFRQHDVPVRETQQLFVSPRHGVADKGGANLSITGSGFVYPAAGPKTKGNSWRWCHFDRVRCLLLFFCVTFRLFLTCV